jgi:hypothetical protein
VALVLRPAREAAVLQAAESAAIKSHVVLASAPCRISRAPVGWTSVLGRGGHASVLRVALVKLHRIAARRDNVLPDDRAIRQLHLAWFMPRSNPPGSCREWQHMGARAWAAIALGTTGRMPVAASHLLALLVGSAQCFTRVATRQAGGGVTHLHARRACAPAGAYRSAYGPSAYDKCVGAKPARPLLPLHR